MKKIGLIAVVLISLVSCQNKADKLDVKIDSPYKVLYNLNGNYQMCLGKVVGYEKRAVLNKDSSESSISNQPIWSLKVPDPARKDTMKKDGKPVYDSTQKTYIFNDVWYTLVPKEREVVKIQIINI